MARTREKEPTPREEALRSLDHAIRRVNDPEPFDALSRRLLAETLRHTKDHVAAIREAKTPPRMNRRQTSAQTTAAETSSVETTAVEATAAESSPSMEVAAGA